jgi:hypothetical protein
VTEDLDQTMTVREWLFAGRCWACHRPNRDHTLAELGQCLDRPLAIVIVKEDDKEK